MEEILEGQIYDCIWDDYRKELIKTKIYNIYLEEETIYVDAPLPVRQLKKLRKILEYNSIEYKNIIIGKPYI